MTLMNPSMTHTTAAKLWQRKISKRSDHTEDKFSNI